MTRENKELLLKDLCARLPYEVKGVVYAEVTNGKCDLTGEMVFFDSAFDVILDEINTSTEEIHVVAIGNEDTFDFIECQQTDAKPYTIEEFKPYLRPMSSMTDSEAIEWHKTTFGQRWITEDNIERCIDWLNAHHFDFRGLIEKGLAIDATGLKIY